MTIRADKRALALAATLLLGAAPAWGAGFQVGEESAAATAMAGAFTAKADGPEAIFYNAAGIAALRGLHAYVGGMLIIGRASAEGTAAFPLPGIPPGGEQDARWSTVFIPNVYVSYGFAHGLAVGVGMFTNMGLKISWPGDWAGRFLSNYAAIEDVTINPTFAWQPFSWLSIGAGLDVTPARTELRQVEGLVSTEAELRFRGNAVGVGGNVGVLIRTPRVGKLPEFDLGVQYRSRYDLNFDDGALQANNVPLELSVVLHDAKATASVPIPDTVSVGLGVRALERLFLQAQFDWTGWSRFQTLTLTSPGNPQLTRSLPENWHDGYAVRVGGELASERIIGRLGVGYDWSPAPASTLGPAIPDGDRVLVTGGVGVPLPHKLQIDFGMMGVIFLARDSALPEFPVRYDNWAVLFSLGISYQH